MIDKEMQEGLEVFYGKVIWFSGQKGIGFLQWERNGVKQRDMFTHYSNIVMEGFKVLYKDQLVSFSIGKNNHGDPKAINVTVLKQ